MGDDYLEVFNKRGLRAPGQGSIAIFCGAGISRRSGLPIVGEIVPSMLNRLKIDENDLAPIFKVNDKQLAMPFEVFMQLLSNNSDITKIFDIYTKGRPNANHILIAKLAKAGIIKTIVTTNFDTLIEDALESEADGDRKLEKGKDFLVYTTEKKMDEFDANQTDDCIIVFKLHGCASDYGTIRTTMNLIASQPLSRARAKIIDYLFCSGCHRLVLVLGYSCSDKLDINQHITHLEKDRKPIIFVSHSGKDIPDPFKKFDYDYLKDTDLFVERLWCVNRDKLNLGKYVEIDKKEVDWETDICSWADKINSADLNLLIYGDILFKVSSYMDAICYYKKYLDARVLKNDAIGESAGYARIGNGYYGLSDFNKALRCHEKALSVAEKSGNADFLSGCYANIGNMYQGLGGLYSYTRADQLFKIIDYFKKAIYYQNQSIELKKKSGNIAAISSGYTNLGCVHYGLGFYQANLKGVLVWGLIGSERNIFGPNDYDSNYFLAIEYQERALDLLADSGELDKISSCHTNIGNAYHGLEDYEEAIAHYKESLEIKIILGDLNGISGCHMNLGSSYFCSGRNKRITLGALYKDDYNSDFEKAIKNIEESLKIAELNGFRNIQRKSCINLANVYEWTDNPLIRDYYLGKIK